MINVTKVVECRDIKIGGGNPISIQSMLNVNPYDEGAILRQINELKEAGCDIVRLAVPDIKAVETLKSVRGKTDMPLVADIHFDYRLAIESIKAGADKIRINPGNIGGEDRLKAVVSSAKERNIPIRVGVNSGSLEKDIMDKYGKVTAEGLAESAIRNLNYIENLGYDNLVVSLKSSDVSMNYKAHKIICQMTDHPVHIGITEAGTLKRGMLKSAIGLGALLLEGIGDTMRVSLTANPVKEVEFAREILESINLISPSFDLVSCPTCGRTQVALQKLADETEMRLQNLISENKIRRGLKIAVMGCVVNGPGEAKSCDYGIAGGKGKGIIFKKGEVIETVKEDILIDRLMRIIAENEGITA